MRSREPEFMQELHRIRAKLSRKWAKMSNAEFLSHMNTIGKEFRNSMRSRRAVFSHSK